MLIFRKVALRITFSTSLTIIRLFNSKIFANLNLPLILNYHLHLRLILANKFQLTILIKIWQMVQCILQTLLLQIILQILVARVLLKSINSSSQQARCLLSKIQVQRIKLTTVTLSTVPLWGTSKGIVQLLVNIIWTWTNC